MWSPASPAFFCEAAACNIMYWRRSSNSLAAAIDACKNSKRATTSKFIFLHKYMLPAGLKLVNLGHDNKANVRTPYSMVQKRVRDLMSLLVFRPNGFKKTLGSISETASLWLLRPPRVAYPWPRQLKEIVSFAAPQRKRNQARARANLIGCYGSHYTNGFYGQ